MFEKNVMFETSYVERVVPIAIKKFHVLQYKGKRVTKISTWWCRTFITYHVDYRRLQVNMVTCRWGSKVDAGHSTCPTYSTPATEVDARHLLWRENGFRGTNFTVSRTCGHNGGILLRTILRT